MFVNSFRSTMTAPNIETDDLIVLLLGAPGPPQAAGRIEGVTRLEKLAFLLEMERKPSWLTERAEFASDNFGPFSSKLYSAADTLAAAELILDSNTLSASTEDSWEAKNIIGETADPYATRNFELTERGQRYYQALISELPEGVEVQLSEFKTRFAALPLRQLIRYVYERYPEYTDNSIIRDSILG
jgi:uncharacterized protein